MGKDRVRSNNTKDWFAKHKKRKRGGDRAVKLRVPLPLAAHDRTGPGTFEDKYDAEVGSSGTPRLVSLS